jgi:enoyl-[acyl-carrier protein] reductase I
MLSITFGGRRALVTGVADDRGLGFAIAKAFAEADATVCLGIWPRAQNAFTSLLARGDLDASLALPGGGKMTFEAIYPLDAALDCAVDVPSDPRDQRRYREIGDVSIEGLADRIRGDLGERPLDVVVHSIANGPEVRKPLLDTSRGGYLTAIGVSAYSFASMVSRLGPLMRPGGSFLALTYLGANRVVPGYGGGMSSAKAALESDVRVLAYEAGRKWGHRVNAISAGPWNSRAGAAIGIIDELITHCELNSPLPRRISARDVATAAAFLCSPLASSITGTTLYVDNGFNVMGVMRDGGASPEARG